MLNVRSGYPEVDEIVLCKVSKIFPNSVFVDLLEYDKAGIVHISEVSPGRIRNLREFVTIDRQIVCKVLRVDAEKGHIDLSLRRVNSTQRGQKLEEVKQELKAESLIKAVAKKLGMPFEKLYNQVTPPLFKEYSHLFHCFQEIAEGKVKLESLGMDKKWIADFQQAIEDKFKPKTVEVDGEVFLQTYESAGVDKIKEILQKIKSLSPTLSLSYLGGGRYRMVVVDFEYKDVEATLKKVQDLLEPLNDKTSKATYTREKND